MPRYLRSARHRSSSSLKRALPRVTRTKRGGGTDFGLQLLEKQKARFTYGLSESQFSKYVHESMEKRGTDSAVSLVTRLESRLDTIVFRAGFVKTRRAARQLVSHGHVQVNGKRVNIPSYMVSVGEVISIRPETRTSPLFMTRAEVALEHKAPTWLKMSADGFSAEVTAVPVIPESELAFKPAIIIQFYSR